MAAYEYLCDHDGVFEVHFPIGKALSSVPCPYCDENARRKISVPMISRVSRSMDAAIEKAESTRERPGVVNSPPPKPNKEPRISRNPKHRNLPRT